MKYLDMLKNKKDMILHLSILSLSYILLYLFYTYYLNYNLFRSDVLSYYNDSQYIYTHFHKFHLPGYPFIIYITQKLLIIKLSPLYIMLGINLSFLLICYFLLYRLFYVNENISHRIYIYLYLFVLWPFVGLVFTVYPIADIPAMLFFIAGLLLIYKRKIIFASIAFSCAIMIHKAIWIFIFFVIIADFIKNNKYTWKYLVSIIIMLLPIATWWYRGSQFHGSWIWLFSSNINAEMSSQSNLLLLDGLIGTFFTGGLKGIIKGSIISLFLFFTIYLLYINLKYKLKFYHYGVAICVSILILFIFLNQYEIWAAVRYNRLLSLPLIFMIVERKVKLFRNNLFLLSLIFFSSISQFGFAVYVANIYS